MDYELAICAFVKKNKQNKKRFVYLIKLYMCTKVKLFNHTTQQCYWLYIGHK